jgi:hypothetical protein
VQNLQKLDCRLISKKHRGFFAKWRGISARDLFFNGYSHGPGPHIRGLAGHTRSTVDRRRRGQRVPERGSALTGVRPPAAPVHQSSPAGVQ